MGQGLVVFIASLIMVFARAFQQLNVQHHKMLWVPPASYAMAITEYVIIIRGYIDLGLSAVLWSGTGAWIGCLLAMAAHRQLRNLYR